MKLTSTGAGGIGTVLAGPSLQARVLRWSHRLLDGVVVTSADAETEARNFFGPRTRLCRIPNGIEIERFVLPAPAEKTALRRQLHLGDGPVALYVGRLHPDKNILGLLDAWRAVAARMPDARLAVVGNGPQQDAAHARAAEHGIQGSVIFCGELRDVRPWYQAADVFVLPSVFEGLSNSLIEAMSSGLAVVSTDVSGSRDVFAAVDIGVMVGDDMQEFAAALIGLFEDEGRRAACGLRARAYAETTFSLDVVARRTEEFYATLLAAPVAS
jgi:glycosyltransferase involved in cell wall biosynthesis